MSAVARTDQQSAAAHVIDIVTGQASEKVRELGHDGIKTFGVGADREADAWAATIADLLDRQCLVRDGDGEDAPLKLTARGADVLFGRRAFASIRAVQPKGRKGKGKAKTKAKAKAKGRSAAEAEPLDAAEEDLFEVLRALRKELAKDRGVPPFVVFSDRTLREMAREKPTTPNEMRQITGVGAVKLHEYGDDFIRQIIRHGECS